MLSSAHLHLIGLLDQVRPADSAEAAHLDFVRDWALSGAMLHRLRKPDVPKIHLVSYFVVVDPAERKLLLVDHRGAGLWLPPGGHVEPDDTDPWATVTRECPEELNVVARPLAATGTVPFFVTATETRGPGTHTDASLWYAIQARAEEVTDYDRREFAGIKWMTPQQILDAQPELFDPHLPRAVRKLTASAISPTGPGPASPPSSR